MDLTSGALRTDQEPPMRRGFSLSEQLAKEVFLEVSRWFIFRENLFDLGMLLNAALEKIEGRVVSIEEAVLDVFFHGYFELASRVALPNFEECIAKLPY